MHEAGDGTIDYLVAIPLTLLMDWKKSPLVFCTATGTVADLANAALCANTPAQTHKLDDHAEAVVLEAVQPKDESAHPISRNPYLGRRNAQLLEYVGAFVDDFLSLAQGPQRRHRHMRRTFFHALDKVLWPLDKDDSAARKEVLSLKKLDAGGCMWYTCKTLLGWLVGIANMTLSLPPHQVERLKYILDEIPPTQQRISIDKWHRMMGELRSMTMALPGARGLFSHIQEALSHVKGKRLKLTSGVHNALADFWWMQ